MKKIITCIVVLLFITSFFIIFALLFNDNEEMTLLDNKKIVYIDDKYLNENIDLTFENEIIFSDEVYVSLAFLTEYDLLDAYWDRRYNRISIFEDFNYQKINYNSNELFYNNEILDIEDVIFISGEELFFNVKFLSEYFIDGITYDSNNKIFIIEDTVREYKLTEDTKFFKPPNLKEIVADSIINADEIVTIYDYSIDNYVLCNSEKFGFGFVDTDLLKHVKTSDLFEVSKDRRQKYINMSWDLVVNRTNNFVEFEIPDVLDVIAPTWYDLIDAENYFLDISSHAYTSYVQESGLELWATFNNSFDPDLTNLLLNNPIRRSEIVDRIIEIAKMEKFDGINIDFENVYMVDRHVYSAFIKELYCKIKDENITMSVAVAVLSNSETWSAFLDRQAIGEYSDYVILMAYDENVSGNAGSVASLPWIEYGVSNLLESVNSGKVIMAVPFYVRLWEEYMLDGELEVKATALRIPTAERVIEENNMEFEYDAATGQNYGEFVEDGILYRMWNEDVTSLQARMDIIDKYDLVGAGVWALSFGTDEMWELLRYR